MQMERMDTVLAVDGVSKQVSSPEGTLTIVDDVSLAIARGESVAIVGASGAGKSTLLALLAGLDTPTSGAGPARGQRLDGARRRRAGRGARATRRVRVPVVPPGAVAHGARERDAAARTQRAAAMPARQPGKSWGASGSPAASGTIRGSCPAANSSASPSRAHSSRSRPCCSPTSRPAISTRPPAHASWTCCSSSTPSPGPRWCSSPTTTHWPPAADASSGSTPGASSQSDTNVAELRFALRNLLRDLRSGELAVLVLALLVAVGSLTAVGFLHQPHWPRGGAAGRAGAGGGPAPRVGPGRQPRRTTRQARERGLAVARVISMPSVVFNGEQSSLVALRAVGAGYPLRGRLKVADRPFGAGARDPRHSGARTGLGGFAPAGQARGRRRSLAARRRDFGRRHPRARLPTRPGQRIRRPFRDAADQHRRHPGDAVDPAGQPGHAARYCLPAIRRTSRPFASSCRRRRSRASGCRASQTPARRSARRATRPDAFSRSRAW